MAFAGKPVLYSYWRSSCSWRVRLVLNLKGIEYETKPVNLIKNGGEQFSEMYKKINPMSRVPALVIDGHTLIESMNIMHYLEETRPQVRLMPQDPFKRAKVREVCDVIVSGIQPLQNLQVLQYVEKTLEKNKLEWAQHWINKGFDTLEKLLSESSGIYCVGDEISLADCCLIPQLYNGRRMKVNLDQYVTLLRIEKALLTLPAFEAAHPNNQPDAPPPSPKK